MVPRACYRNVSVASESPFAGALRLRRGTGYTVPVRIGSVPYLNARPLVYGLARRCGHSLHLASPATLIDALVAGELDVALASTFALLQHPELHLWPTLGVAATGPAWSVRLLSRVPLPEVRSLALDNSSRSSIALARIILADRYGVSPRCIPHAPDLPRMLAVADAAVLIGDVGLCVPGEDLIDCDLGTEWWALTGLPFVFAGWIARSPGPLVHLAPLLEASLDDGLQHLDELAAASALELGYPPDRCARYLHDIIHYRLGAAEQAGLTEFQRRARRLELEGSL
jgi:chorismate dehydratase